MGPRDRRFVAASMAASYAKRILDGGLYERLEEQFGKQLRKISPRQRKTIEAILYFINGYIDVKMTEGGPIDKFMRDVITDAPSELGVRLVNGRHRARHSQELDLSNLTEEELNAFLDWRDQASEADRRVFDEYVKRQTVERLGRYLRISPVLRERLIDYTIEQQRRPASKPIIPERIGFLDRWTAKLRGERRVPCVP